MIVTITNENFETSIAQSKKPVVIDVFATWCGPCQYMKPLFEELANELGDTYTFGELNVDEAREIAIKFGVSSVPSFIFIKNGEMVGKETGSMSKDDLTAKLHKYLN